MLPRASERVNEKVLGTPCRVEHQRSLERAVGDLHFCLNAPPKDVPGLLTLRVKVMITRESYSEAITSAVRLAGLAKTGEEYHRAAVAFAWCYREETQFHCHAVRVIGLLCLARDAGYFKGPQSVAGLLTEKAFEPLHDRDDFKELLADLDKK